MTDALRIAGHALLFIIALLGEMCRAFSFGMEDDEE